MKIKYNVTSFLNIFHDAGIYTITTLASKAVPFLLLPILTHYLSPADYGYVSTFYLVVTIATLFTQLSTHGSVQVSYYQMEEDERSRHSFNTLWIVLFFSSIVLLLFLVFQDMLSSLTMIPSSWLIATVVCAAFDSVTGVLLSLLRISRRTYLYGIIELSRAILNIGSSLLLIVLFHMNWEGRAWGLVLTSLVFFVISMYTLLSLKLVRFSFSMSAIVDHLKFGLPLVPHSLGGMGLALFNRFFLNHYSGVEATGVFTLSYQLASIMEIFATSINTAWIPSLYEKLSAREDNRKGVVVSIYAFSLLFLVAAALLSFTGPSFFSILFPAKYYNAYSLLPWLSFAFAFNGMYCLMSNFISYSRRTYFLGGTTGFISALSIVLNFYLIRDRGAVGAAQAMTLSYLLLFLITWFMSNQCFRMPWFKFMSLARDEQNELSI